MLSSRPENFSQAPYEVIACRKGGFHEEVQFVDFCPGAS
jgi:hypothetical protein